MSSILCNMVAEATSVLSVSVLSMLTAFCAVASVNLTPS